MNRRQNAPLIAQFIVIALLIGSMPMMASPVIVQHESAPAFTLDICNPLPSFALGAASCSLQALTAFSFGRVNGDRGAALESVPSRAGRAIDAPDPPPPKSLV